MNHRSVTRVTLASGEERFQVQFGVQGYALYLGRFNTRAEADAVADASFYHAVAGGFFTRMTLEELGERHFNDWPTARKYVEGGAEFAPAPSQRLLDRFAAIRAEGPRNLRAGRPSTAGEEVYKRLPLAAASELAALRRDVEVLKGAVSELRGRCGHDAGSPTPPGLRPMFAVPPSCAAA